MEPASVFEPGDRVFKPLADIGVAVDKASLLAFAVRDPVAGGDVGRRLNLQDADPRDADALKPRPGVCSDDGEALMIARRR